MVGLILALLLVMAITLAVVIAWPRIALLPIRFSIRNLLLATAAIALYCAVFANPENEWLLLFLPATFGMLGFGILAAMYRRDTARAFWNGFEIFGWGYLALFYFFEWPRRPQEVLMMLLGCLPVALIGGVIGWYLRKTRDSATAPDSHGLPRRRADWRREHAEPLELDAQ